MKELLQNKKLIGIYTLWFTLHLVILIITWGTEYYDTDKIFWPFQRSSLFGTYDLTEFLFYTIVPIFLIIGIYFLSQSKK
jgi:hypothetical protein